MDSGTFCLYIDHSGILLKNPHFLLHALWDIMPVMTAKSAILSP